MWNTAVNDWALRFLPYADIMVESKCKNLASIGLYKYNEGKDNEQLLEQHVRSEEQDTRDTVLG